MSDLKISNSDARGVGFAYAQLVVAKRMLDAGDASRVNAALFALGQMLEPVLYRLEQQDPALKEITAGLLPAKPGEPTEAGQ